jgi:hypothetical protein
MKSHYLSKEEQAYWLRQHIRTRVYAALANRRFVRDLQHSSSADPQKRDYLECIFHATWGGQHAAMRWLIEFVGVECSRDPDVVTIQCFDGGACLKKNSREYAEFEDIWIGCSKATSHPTTGKHPDIKELTLHKAAVKIIRYLAETIYAKAGIPL